MIALPAHKLHTPPRWALSFADLCLVLLGFLLLVQAHRADPQAVGAGIRKAFGGTAPRLLDERAASLFAPGEAILTLDARAHFLSLGASASRTHARVQIESVGTDARARRFDAWELAAARAASIARAVQEGGVPEARIDVAVDATPPRTSGQRLRITVTPQ